MLKNNKTFTKPNTNNKLRSLPLALFRSIRACTLLPILMFSFSMCLLLAPGYAYATDFVTGSYSAGDYSDSSYNQGSDDTSNNSDTDSSSSDNDNSSNSNSNSDESTTAVTNPDTDTTTTNASDATEDQSPIDKSSTTVGVIIAIGVVVLALIAAVLLWVKKHKAK